MSNGKGLSPRHIALGLLIISGLALVVGLFNAAQLQINKIKAEESKKSSVASLLNHGNHLALVELSGMIVMDSESDGLFESESAAMSARKALDSAAEDDSVKGVLLRINSPGGTVAMSQELNRAVYRVSEKKPVVVSLGDVAASGGYYTACAADYIVANPGTLTASIGVIIHSMNLKGLLSDKLGVKPITVKSGQFKDILSPYREPSSAELALLQDLIDDSYADFLGAVVAGRTRFMTDEGKKKDRTAKIKAVADGRIVHGEQALASGLVDEIGDMERAHEILDRMAKERFGLKGKDRLKLTKDEKAFSLMEWLGVPGYNSRFLNRPASMADLYGELMPLTMRYPNQPLWVME